MLSLKTVSAGAVASKYYETDNYYEAGSAEAEAAAQWFGKAAERHGLDGQMDGQSAEQAAERSEEATQLEGTDRELRSARDAGGARSAGAGGQTNSEKFERIMEGYTPDGAKRMGHEVGGERRNRPGLDGTLNASKTASIAAFVYGDNRIIEAHDKAVATTLAIVEKNFAQTRVQVDGKMQTITGVDLIGRSFRHDTSRDLDPHLHTHCVMANMTQSKDGHWTALHNDLIFENQKLITEIYRNAFEREVNAVGIATNRGRYGEVNIEGISEHIAEGFSKRRAAIEAFKEKNGLEDHAATQQIAALKTRAAKQEGIDRGELYSAWREEAKSYGVTEKDIASYFEATASAGPHQKEAYQDRHSPGDKMQAEAYHGSAAPDDKMQSHARAAIESAILHLSDRSAVYRRADLLEAAMRFGRSEMNYPLLEREVENLTASKRLYLAHPSGRLLTDSDGLALERRIVSTLKDSNDKPAIKLSSKTEGNYVRSGEDVLDRSLAQTNLSAGQKAAVRLGLSQTHRIVGIQGYAGTGKTYALEKLAHYAEKNGYEVAAYGPSNKAVSELEKSLPGARTLQSKTTQERNHPEKIDNRNTILIVDEASMINTKDMMTLLDYVKRTGAAKLVLVGDVKQLDSVSAGTPFDLMQINKMPTAVMDDVIRQRNEELRGAVYASIGGEVRDAFAKIGQNLIGDKQPAARAAQLWINLSEQERADTRLITLTNEDRREINQTIRGELQAQGDIAIEDHKIAGLDPLNLTPAEKGDVQSYQKGDIVSPLQSFKTAGLIKDALYTVEDCNLPQNTLTLRQHGTSARFTMRLSQASRATQSLVGYETAERNISIGERLTTRIMDKSQGVHTGMVGTVSRVTKDSVTLQLEVAKEDTKEITIERSSLGGRGLDHTYASTAHGIQGETAENIIAVMNYRSPLATLKAFYVDISRAKEKATLITNNPGKLIDRIANNTGEQLNALTAVLDTRLKMQTANTRVEMETAVHAFQNSPKMRGAFLAISHDMQSAHESAPKLPGFEHTPGAQGAAPALPGATRADEPPSAITEFLTTAEDAGVKEALVKNLARALEAQETKNAQERADVMRQSVEEIVKDPAQREKLHELLGAISKDKAAETIKEAIESIDLKKEADALRDTREMDSLIQQIENQKQKGLEL